MLTQPECGTHASPQDLDAEERVLGAMLLSPNAIDVVRPILDAGDFYRESHATIYSVAVERHERGQPVDSILLVAELEERGMLSDVGGRVRIHELANLVPATANAAHYARIVRAKATERRAIEAFRPVWEGLWNGGLAPGEALEAVERLSALAGETATAERPFAVALDAFIDDGSADPEVALLGPADEPLLPAGALAILAGKAGVGKTTLALDLALHAASAVEWLDLAVARPLRVLLIENEGPRQPFRAKLGRMRDRWRHELRETMFVHDDEWGALTLADPRGRARLRAFLDRERVDLVICDPLGSLGVEGVGSPAETRAFVALLRQAGLGRAAFVLLHHLRKEATDDEIDQLSGAWGAHADSILVLKRAGRCRARLSFPKLRWSSPRDALTLASEHESFSVVRAELAKAVELDDRAERIEAYLDEHPSASANEIAREVGGNRQDTLAAVKAARAMREQGQVPDAATRRFPLSKNHSEPAGSAPTSQAVPPAPSPPTGEGRPGTPAGGVGSGTEPADEEPA